MYPKDRTLDLSLGEKEFLTVDIIWHACGCLYAILPWPISSIQEKLQTTIKLIVTRLWRDSQFCQFRAGRLQKLETEPSHGHETFVSLAAVVESVFISNLATAASSSTSPQQLRTTSLNLLLFSFRNLTVWECRVHDDDEDDEETVSSRSSSSSGFFSPSIYFSQQWRLTKEMPLILWTALLLSGREAYGRIVFVQRCSAGDQKRAF
jgi:hypothetical protein